MSAAHLPRRSAFVPLLVLTILAGLLAGGVLLALDLVPHRERVVYQRPSVTTVPIKVPLSQIVPSGNTGSALLDCVTKYLHEHGGDQITRREGMTSKAFQQLSLQAQFTCIGAGTTGAGGTASPLPLPTPQR